MSECEYFYEFFRNELMLGSQPLAELAYCQLNISQCAVSESSSKFVINIYNSLSRDVDKYVRVPVIGGIDYAVFDPDG